MVPGLKGGRKWREGENGGRGGEGKISRRLNLSYVFLLCVAGCGAPRSICTWAATEIALGCVSLAFRGMLQKIQNVLQSKNNLSHVKVYGKMVTPCLYLEYLQAAALCPFQPATRTNQPFCHYALPLALYLCSVRPTTTRRMLLLCG